MVAEAPNGVLRLRELVLELAVRGKLVAQDPRDEPASALLERIVEEKAELVKEGKIKGVKPLPAIEVGDVPFEVPDTWRWTRFGDITNSRLGKMLDKAKNQGTYRRYLRNANVQWFRFDLDDVLELRLEEDQLDEYTIREGDLVICEGGEPGRAAVASREVDGMVFQKALHRARPWSGVSVWFLAYVLRHDTWSGRLARYFTGATIKHLTGKALASYVLPLAPPAEQRRIVAEVDELMDLIDRLEAARTAREATRTALRDSALAALSDAAPDEVEIAWKRIDERIDDLIADPADVEPLRQTVLQLAVRGRLVEQDPADQPASMLLERIAKEKARLVKGGRSRKSKVMPSVTDQDMPFALPEGWAYAQLGVMGEFINGDRGKNYPARDAFVESGVPFINAGHMRDGAVDLSEMNYISQARFDLLKSGKVENGDLLYCLRGSLGKAAIVDGVERGAIASSLLIVRPFVPDCARWLFVVLTSPLGADLVRKYDNGSAQPNLSASNVKKYLVPIPPLAEQQRVLRRLDELMALLGRLQDRLSEQQATQDAFAAAAVHHLDDGRIAAEAGGQSRVVAS